MKKVVRVIITTKLTVKILKYINVNTAHFYKMTNIIRFPFWFS